VTVIHRASAFGALDVLPFPHEGALHPGLTPLPLSRPKIVDREIGYGTTKKIFSNLIYGFGWNGNADMSFINRKYIHKIG
jgi:hypothetical protein